MATNRHPFPILVEHLRQQQAVELAGHMMGLIETWARLQKYRRTQPQGPSDCAVSVDLIVPQGRIITHQR